MVSNEDIKMKEIQNPSLLSESSQSIRKIIVGVTKWGQQVIISAANFLKARQMCFLLC